MTRQKVLVRFYVGIGPSPRFLRHLVSQHLKDVAVSWDPRAPGVILNLDVAVENKEFRLKGRRRLHEMTPPGPATIKETPVRKVPVRPSS